MGIIVTILVISQSYFKALPEQGQNPSLANLKPWLQKFIPWLQNLIIVIPIIISILVAMSTFFRFGNKWVNLRTAAETLKSEIYQFRTSVGKYNTESIPQNQPITKPEDSLFNQIQTISNQLMGT